MVSLAAGAMEEGVAHAIEFETHILHLSEAAGASVESLSGLAFAAKMFGLSVDDVGRSLERFDKQMISAGAGNAKAQQNMSLLGIDPAEIKTSDQALMALADHFAAMPDGVLKTGEALQAFGKSGAAMLPLLDEGSKGLQKYMDIARSLGQVFTQEDAEAALHFQRNMQTLHGEVDGFFMAVEKSVIPNLNAWTDAIVKNSATTQTQTTLVDAVKFSLQVAASVIVLTVAELKELGVAFELAGQTALYVGEAIVDAFSAISKAATGDLTGAKQSLQAMKDDLSLLAVNAQQEATKMVQIGKDAASQLSAIWGAGRQSGAVASGKAHDAAASAAAAAAIDKWKKSVEGLISSQKLELETLGMTAEETQEYKIRAEAVALGQQKWAESEIAIMRAQNSRKTVLKDIEEIEDETKAEQKLLTQQAKVKSLQEELLALQQILDVEMKPTNTPDFASGMALLTAPGVSPAFQQAFDELQTQLEHQIATWGMTTDQVTAYNLALQDSSTTAKAMTQNVIALQDKLQHMENVTAAWKEFENIGVKTLDELVFSGKSLGQVLSDLAKQLGEMAIKWALMGSPSQNGQGGLFGAIFTGLKGLLGFASGGGVSSGTPILVGENGPEIFTPSVTGAIIPNSTITGMGRGGAAVNYYIDARGSSITEEQFRRSLQLSENRAVQRSLNATREMSLRTP